MVKKKCKHLAELISSDGVDGFRINKNAWGYEIRHVRRYVSICGVKYCPFCGKKLRGSFEE